MGGAGWEASRGDRTAGATLVGVGILIPIGMLHHPTHVEASMLSPIHGVLILLLIGGAFGFAHVAVRLGGSRPAVLAGAVSYALSVVANLLAGLVNGFVVPRLHAAGSAGDQLGLLWILNQTLAEFAVLSCGAALLLWGVALLRAEGTPSRILGLAGIAAGAVPAVLLLVGAMRMDVGGALLAYGLQAMWGALAGAALLSGRFEGAQSQRG
jgi:drug/metabolite transporter (DMT)-like permease